MLADITDIYFQPVAVIVGAYLVGHLLTWLLFAMIRRWGRRSESVWLQSIRRNLRRPARFTLPLLVAWISVSAANLEEDLENVVSTGFEILVYIGLAWLIVEFTDVISDLIRDRYRMDDEDNLQERKILTQMAYIKKVVGVVVTIIAVAVILMQFQTVREIGAGMLTSAGIAGIVIGIAAQRPISNLLAGFQIAFTQPMRLDDVVIVENEWGRIEEITLTYVVVRIWDQRRLVLPLMYFIEKPFQNWTRSSSEILGTVYIYTDYRLPIEELRNKLTELLKSSKLWDGRVNVLQVTDATDTSIQVRALMSAANSSEAWDLRCFIREKLITYIQEEFPFCLPRTRLELPQENGREGKRYGRKSPEHEKEGLSDSSETRVDKKEN